MAFSDLRSQARRKAPAELIQHLQTFQPDCRFSAGIWFFSPSGSRFHRKYSRELPIEARLEIAARLHPYGLRGLEAHYPNEISEQNIDLWKKFSRDTGIRIVTVIPLLFLDEMFEWGSLSNPDDAIRKEAVNRTIRAFELNRELDTDFAVVWPGIDGYENPFGLDFAAMRDRFSEGLAAAMDAVPGIRIAFEPKPYEPRGRILFGSTAEGMLLCHDLERRLAAPKNRSLIGEGHSLACLNPEVGHVLMAFEDLAYAYSWPLSEGRLAHIHLNSQPLGNYDQDLNVGVISVEQTEAMLYVLRMHGYQGWYGIDINPERMPVETALRINMDAIRAAHDRLAHLDHEAIVNACLHPAEHRGWLESYLIRARAMHPEQLPPI
jgi:xylose isomerase